MPVFEYRALTHDGREASGLLNADTPRDARDRLRGQRLLVTDLRLVQEPGTRPSGLRGLLRLPRRRDAGEVALLTRQLATLLKAGIPLAESLAALIQQTGRPALEKGLRDIREKVLEGATLADAMARHPRWFDALYVSMVRAGEASGTLDLILRRLSDFNQRQAKVANRVTAALVYPLLIAAVAAGVVAFLMTVVVPRIELVFIAQHRQLPWITSSLIAASRFIRRDWLFLLAGVAASALAGRALLESEHGGSAFDRLSLRLPVVGDVLKKQIIARFAATLATLLDSGLPVLEALQIVGRVMTNRVMARTVREIHDRIAEGADISTPLQSSGIFPPVVGYMIAVGEESGQLEEILNTLAEAYEEEVEVSTQKLIALLEPVMIILMALVVGYIVVSIVLPILDMTQAYQRR